MSKFDDPSLGQHHELARVGVPHDVNVHRTADPGQPVLELPPLVAGVGVKLHQKRIHSEQGRHEQHPAVTILDIGRVYDGLHQQALGVDEDVPLFAVDLLAAIEARPINPRPPFSALLTLWLSMIATVGLTSRSACSRQRT